MNYQLIQELLDKYPAPALLMQSLHDHHNWYIHWLRPIPDFDLPDNWKIHLPDTTWSQPYLLFLGPGEHETNELGRLRVPIAYQTPSYRYTYFEVWNAST